MIASRWGRPARAALAVVVLGVAVAGTAVAEPSKDDFDDPSRWKVVPHGVATRDGRTVITYHPCAAPCEPLAEEEHAAVDDFGHADHAYEALGTYVIDGERVLGARLREGDHLFVVALRAQGDRDDVEAALGVIARSVRADGGGSPAPAGGAFTPIEAFQSYFQLYGRGGSRADHRVGAVGVSGRVFGQGGRFGGGMELELVAMGSDDGTGFGGAYTAFGGPGRHFGTLFMSGGLGFSISGVTSGLQPLAFTAPFEAIVGLDLRRVVLSASARGDWVLLGGSRRERSQSWIFDETRFDGAIHVGFGPGRILNLSLIGRVENQLGLEIRSLSIGLSAAARVVPVSD